MSITPVLISWSMGTVLSNGFPPGETCLIRLLTLNLRASSGPKIPARSMRLSVLPVLTVFRAGTTGNRLRELLAARGYAFRFTAILRRAPAAPS